MSAGVFGRPPENLAPIPEEAAQFSPLIPGAENLENAPPASLDSMAMLASPGTIERRYHLALALRALKPGAPLVALAPKDKGGSRIAKELRELGCEVEEDSKSHHRICTVARPKGSLPLDEALAEGAMRFDKKLELFTQPGVFSWDRLDPGSALLLERLPALSGRGADLGAGIGWLSRAILKSPKVEKLILAELDRRAIDCARKNVQDARADFRWCDLRHIEWKDTGLDFVVTNPPFHDSGLEDHGLGKIFLSQAAFLLRPGGTCWLVANKHLPYEAEMKTLFSTVKPVIETGGYKIYEAMR